MKTRGIFFLLAICVLTICIWWWHRSDKPSDVVADDNLSTSMPSAEGTTPLIPKSNSSPESSPSTVIWSLVDNQSDMPEIPNDHGDVVDAVPLKLNLHWALNVAVGDEITVGIPQLSSRYTVIVDNLKIHLGSIKTLTASTPGSAIEVSMTLGERNTFASISTPEGSYDFVGNVTHGWLMPSANMDHPGDYKKPDYVIKKIKTLTEFRGEPVLNPIAINEPDDG